MLSIDEAITHAREVAKRNREQWKNCPADRRDIEHQTCEQCAEEHEQLANWLEELKSNRIALEKANGYLEVNHRLGYNKAIDDFAHRLTEYLDVENATKYGNKNAEQQRNSYDTLMKYEIADAIDDVTEQLKAGIEDEKEKRM